MKIRNKLTYKFVLLVAGILFLFSLAIFFFTNNYREEQFDKRLVDRGITTAKLLIQVDEVDIKLLKIIDRNNLTALNHEKVTVYNETGDEIYSSDEEPRVPLNEELKQKIFKDKIFYFNYKDDEAVGLIYDYKGTQYLTIVSAYDTFGWKKIKHLKNLLIISYILSLLLIFVAGYYYSGEALNPISNIVKEVNAISIRNLDTMVNEGNRQDEIAQLAITFNKMLKRLNDAFKVQKSFVANASHELRTPLTSIKAQLQVALMNERKKIQYQHILESILQDVDSLVNLMNGLLKIAQIDHEINPSEFKKIRIDELMLTCVGEMNKKFLNQIIHYNIEEYPEDDSEFIVSGDELLLKTAFCNVLDNACKYASGNPVNLQIVLFKEYIEIQVWDQGMGINQDELKHIFEPFFRGKNIMHLSGNGIGLSLTKSIVELHHGKLIIDSSVGLGTSVTFRFAKCIRG